MSLPSLPRTVPTLLLVLLALGPGPACGGPEPRHPRPDAAVQQALHLNEQVKQLQAQGAYREAIDLARRALALAEQAVGPDDPHVAFLLNNLAVLYDEIGDFTSAEPLYERALDIKLRAFGVYHPSVAASLVNLAYLHQAKGDYRRAEPLYERALQILRRELSPDDPVIAKTLSNLAVLHAEQGHHDRALPVFEQVVAAYRKALGPSHPELALALDNLAVAVAEQGEVDRAEELHRQALAMFETELGPDHPSVAAVLTNLATLHSRERGDHAKAVQLHERALAIRTETLGPAHPDVASSLIQLAIVHLAQHRWAEAVRRLRQGNDVRERNLDAITRTGSQDQKRVYVQQLRGETAITITLHTEHLPNDTSARRLGLTTVLRRKGRALEASTDVFRSLRGQLGAGDLEQLDELASVRSRQAALVLRGPGAASPQEHHRTLRSLEQQAQRLEVTLSRRSPAFRATTRPVSIDEVRSRIPANAALVEIVAYQPYRAKARGQGFEFAESRYLAYVLQPDGELRSVDLGDQRATDELVAALRTALADPAADASKPARALDQTTLQRIAPLLGKATHLLISPDGQLNLVPFGALVDRRGKYRIEALQFTYLTSGRDLLRIDAAPAPRQGAIILADPAFDTVPAHTTNAASKAAPQRTRSAATSRVRFTALPGTADEARALGELLEGAEVHTGAQATVAALEAVRGPRILHIATHGFFLQTSRPPLEGTRGLELVTTHARRLAQPADPLLRSGIALAGANHQGRGSDDGLVTASEVAGLDLHGTQLVALSACETGVGDVENGEGVYGLRRALVLAGAQSQLMSLWKVDDEATRDLMVHFYRLLQKGHGRSRALRAAQRAMLKRKARRHPYYWGAFVLNGAWSAIGPP